MANENVRSQDFTFHLIKILYLFLKKKTNVLAVYLMKIDAIGKTLTFHILKRLVLEGWHPI